MIDLLNQWFGYIQDRYGVSPLVFGIIYAVSFAPCWYCVFKILRAFKQHDRKRLTFWAVIFALFFISPYAYVYLFGRNYPIWFHAIFAIFVVFTSILAIKKIRKMIVQRAAS